MIAWHRIDFSKLLLLISQILVESANFVESNSLDAFYLRNFNAINTINEILSRNWTENSECLNELNAVKNGIDKHEEWAIKGKLYFTLGHFFLINSS